MKVALGFKAHSGWAALVALGKERNGFVVVDRRRIELVEEEWARQPYHAAEDLESEEARILVARGIEAARRVATRELEAAVKRELDLQNKVTRCAVLVGNPMPDWTVEQILAVHFRMHKAEGVLFRDALVHAARENRLKVIEFPEKSLMKDAERELGTPAGDLIKRIATIGKTAGPPWGKDQKEAALAAMVALA